LWNQHAGDGRGVQPENSNACAATSLHTDLRAGRESAQESRRPADNSHRAGEVRSAKRLAEAA